MGWLSNFLKDANNADVPSPNTGFHDQEGQPVPISLEASNLRAARELVHNAATETASVYGLPQHWLSFEVVTISDAEKAYFQLQVLMNHWDEYMAAHSYAFERAVIKRIREENVDVGRAVRAVLWRVGADAGCPYDDMPEPQAWGVDAIKDRGMVRDRINRELYALTTPASGARVGMPAGAKVPAMMPMSADEAARADQAARAGSSTLPEGGSIVSIGATAGGTPPDNPEFSDTHPSSAYGFESTVSTDPTVPAKARQ